jgi:hypothetical protein
MVVDSLAYSVTQNTVMYFLKAETVKQEKQPLLPNDSETTFVPMQRLGKHVPAATYTHATVQVPVGNGVFYSVCVKEF